MITITIPKEYANTKLISTIQKIKPDISYGTIQKLLKNKDIKVNGKRISSNILLNAGDTLELYLPNKKITLDIVYEDDNILIVNKPFQIEVISLENETDLLTLVKEYSNLQSIYPIHRLDRNTKGLVVFAKDNESLKILEEKIKNKEIQKFYLCEVLGKMPKPKDTLTDYLFKDSKKSVVYISNTPKTGYQQIITKYKVLKENIETSMLEVELVTGRTHQIRAHLAFTGHPIIGDGKYGNNEINKKFHKKFQELTAYKLQFNFTTDADKLNYLQGKTIKLEILSNIHS